MNNVALIVSIVVALIAAITSLIVAVINSSSTRKLESYKSSLAREEESYKSELGEKEARNKARMDYEQDALKRLYQQYEPLRFQLFESCENAKARVYSLARTARAGDLGPYSSGWLSSDGYYTISTIYYLLAPLAIVKLMQRLLTFVDLALDPSINIQYIIAKQLYISFTDDFIFARISPPLEYHPNAQDRKQYPEKCWKQGIAAGRLEKVVEALIVHVPDEPLHCMSYGEFEDAYNNVDTREKLDAFADIFFNFHPKTRPILWRMLIAQIHIHEALLSTRKIKGTNSDAGITPKLVKPFSEEDLRNLDWRCMSDEATDEEVLSQPFEVAQAYLRENLGSIFAS